MVSLSDIVALLEKIPAWKNLTALPKRMEALEARIATLESCARGGSCKGCRKADPLLIAQTKAPSPFGDLGAMVETYRCPACGQETTKHLDPQ